MIRNYSKIAWRNLIREKGFSALNILGLTIGIVCSSLIFLWIQYKYETNRYFEDHEQVYIVKNNQQYGDDIMTFSSTSGPLAAAMYREVPGFDAVARVLDHGGVLGVGDTFLSRSGLYADSSFFDILSYPTVSESTDYSAGNPNQIALSSELAKTLFKDSNPIDQVVSFNKKDLFTVKKVYDFPDENITIKPGFIISMNKAFQDSSFVRSWSGWGQCGIRTYAKLEEQASLATVNQKLKPLVKEKSGQSVSHEVFLYPITRLSVYNSFKNGVEQPGEGNIKYIRLFGMIGVIILIIACINFMNLSTARSERRAKEIGLKKVVGASRPQIMGQFMLESILTAMLALVLAILVLYIAVPLFGRMLEMDLSFRLFTPATFGGLLAIGLFCGILAGSYPSIYLSSFNPLNALKKKRKSSRIDGAGFIRKGLVITQFSVAIVLMVCVAVIYSQINHARNRDLGYDLNMVMSISTSGQLIYKLDALKQELKSKGVVTDVAIATSSILGVYSNGGGFSWPGKDDSQDPLISFMGVDAAVLPLLDLELAGGRNFKDASENGNNIIVNDAFARLMGEEGKVGKSIFRGNENYNIIGITRPFVYNDLYGADQPLMFFSMSPEQISAWGGSIYVKLAPGAEISDRLKQLETVVKSYDSSLPFSYNFLDEQYDAMFKGTRFTGKLAMLFGVLATFISCLGLFGLSAYTAASRIKEIGVRKVLGAGLTNLSLLLSIDFLRLVAISFVIAAPVAWYLMTQWLKDFHYRVEMKWWLFALIGLLSIGIAIITVSFQAVKAALANPVKSLRSE